MEQCLIKGGEENVAALDADDTELAKTLTVKYNLNLNHYFTFNSALVTLYQNKIAKLKECEEDEQITALQKEQIAKEMKAMEDICSLGLKGTGDIKSILDKNVFGELLENFEEKCLLLHSVIQKLLVTDDRRRVHKTPVYKLTCGVNALALLLSVRNQKCKNDVRLLLGLVCITYGAGKQFINLLNTTGLTPHWDTL